MSSLARWLLLLPTVSGLQLAPRCAPTFQAALPERVTIQMAAKFTDADGNEIKAALSAYMHFCAERRSSLAAELKAKLGSEFANTLVMKQLGVEWKLLEPYQKDKFEQAAVADKARFAAAVASNPANDALPKTKRKSPASEGKPKAKSSYMIFCGERRDSLTAELKARLGAEFEYKQVMVSLGEEWRNMGDAGKAKYVAMSEAQKAELAAAA